MNEVRIGGSLVVEALDTPTRKGEYINLLQDIYDITTPYTGMKVFCAETGTEYVVTELTEKIINGVVVIGAMVKSFIPLAYKGDVEALKKYTNEKVDRLDDVATIRFSRILEGTVNVTPSKEENPVEIVFYKAGGKFVAKNAQGKYFDEWDGKEAYMKNGELRKDCVYMSEGSFYMWNGTTLVLDVELTNEIARAKEAEATLQANISAEAERAKAAEQTEKTRALAAEEVLRGGATQRFGSIEEATKTIMQGAQDFTLAEVVYYKPGKMFVAKGKDDNLYDTWSGMDAYMNGRSIRQDKVYICGSALYVWNGTELVDVTAELKQQFADLIGEAPETLDSIHEIAAWINNDKTGAAAMATQIAQNKSDIASEAQRATAAEAALQDNIGAAVASVEEARAADTRKLVNGDTIVGVAREVYSRQGKTDTATFLRRTTAGNTSISDGVASIKQIGGNIVKNLVDGTIGTGYTLGSVNCSVENGIGTLTSTGAAGYGDFIFKDVASQQTHKYYASALVNIIDGTRSVISFSGGFQPFAQVTGEGWQLLSVWGQRGERGSFSLRIYSDVVGVPASMYFKNPLLIDLTEMFGAGKEPTKEECDKMFSSMGALPKGLTVAQPAELKSVGYNHWKPSNMLANSTINANGTITANESTSIAIVKCVSCKMGAGENNGYVIGYGEGKDWSDAGIEVYLSPLNPMETAASLYLQKLAKDETFGTYMPQINGYLLVVTPVTDKLCAHLRWSGDRAATDYEEYIESTVSLPSIPQMSEWGLAAVGVTGNRKQDTINLERNIYTKRVGRVDLGTFSWNRIEQKWACYTYEGKNIYTPFGWGSATYAFISTDFSSAAMIKVSLVSGDNFLIVTEAKGDYQSGETYMRNSEGDATVIAWHSTAAVTPTYPTNDFFYSNIVTEQYRTAAMGEAYYGATTNCIATIAGNRVGIIDLAFNNKTAAEVKGALSGVMLYYEIDEEEYPIVTKAAPNYIGSDYGVEEFEGSQIPLEANILFYMRSLVSETRNFLDRLMGALGSDVVAVADKIIAAVNSANVINEEVEGDDTRNT